MKSGLLVAVVAGSYSRVAAEGSRIFYAVEIE